MTNTDTNELAGRDDALYRTLGLLIRHLHVKGIIDAPDLTREIRLLANQIDNSTPQNQTCIACMEAIAATVEGEQAQWSEARLVHTLYRADQDPDLSGR